MRDRWVDVSHEALIRGWPRLRRWIEEDRAGLRVHLRLAEAALEWDKTGRDSSALYRGVRLAQAVEWRQGKDAALNDLERAFLDAGIALERQEIESRERLRQRVIGGLSVALAIFAVLAGLAFQQWRQANRRGQIALARQLAAQADLVRDQPEAFSRRLWFAVEAMQRLHAVGADSLEVDATLRRELAFSPRHVGRFPVKVVGEIYEAQLSPDGRFVIGGNFTEGAASVWEIATHKELVRIETNVRELTATTLGHKLVRMQIDGQGEAHIAGLSPDGTYLATMNSGEGMDIAQVWEVATGGELLRLEIHGTNSYALSDDGRYLGVSTSIFDPATQKYSEAVTRVWNVKTRQEIPGQAPGDVRTFSRDAKYVATSKGLWEIAGGLKETFGWGADIFYTAFSPEGGYVAVKPFEEGDLELWSIATRQKVVKKVKGPPQALGPDGKLAIVGSLDDAIQTLDLSTDAVVSQTGLPGRFATITPSGRQLIATVSVDAEAVDVWELGPPGGAVLAADPGAEVVAVGITPQGRLTTIARKGETLISRTWDVDTGQEKTDLALEIAGTGAAFAPDGVSFVVSSKSGLEVRKAGDPQPVTKLAYPGPQAIAWSPDGRYLAAAAEKEARVWDLNNRRPVGQIALPGPPTVLSALAVASGGETLAAMIGAGTFTRSGEVYTAKLWNVASGAELNSFEPDKGESIREDTYCALNARYLVTQNLKILDMKSGTTVFGLNEGASGCVLSADGQSLAASVNGEIVWVWDLKNQGKALRITTQDRPLAFDQESRYLATISREKAVRVWPLRQDDLIAEACRRLPRNLTEEEWRASVGDEAYHKTCPELP
jgi:WD40 repeat protein